MSSHISDREAVNACEQVPQLGPTTPPSATGLPPPIGGPSESSLVTDCHACHCTSEEQTRQCRDDLTIDVLPDEVLLEIFNFYVCKVDREEEWETLVHVCRRWRYLVFGSPRSLDLRLICTEGTPARDMLDIWPASLPITIRMFNLHTTMEDTLCAAFEQIDRVCEIDVEVLSTDGLQILAEVMPEPFSSLTNLVLGSPSHKSLVVPDSLLGGSSPRLENLYLKGLSFPALPKLLLSATGLVSLFLLDIPPSGYISPEAMVECLSLMTQLEELGLRFRPPQSRPRRANLHPPLTRTVLPVFNTLQFKGAHDYLYHLFIHIDAPLLESVKIRFFKGAVFDTSQIAPFIGHTETFEAFKHVHMLYRNEFLLISLSSRAGAICDKTLLLSLKYSRSVWQLQSLSHCYRPPLTDFDLQEQLWLLWGDGMPDSKWTELLHLFPALETMCISQELGLYFAPGLEELGGDRVTEVLPALQYLFIQGLLTPIEEAFGKFVAARRLSGHPIAIRCWPGEDIVQYMRQEAVG